MRPNFTNLPFKNDLENALFKKSIVINEKWDVQRIKNRNDLLILPVNGYALQ